MTTLIELEVFDSSMEVIVVVQIGGHEDTFDCRLVKYFVSET